MKSHMKLCNERNHNIVSEKIFYSFRVDQPSDAPEPVRTDTSHAAKPAIMIHSLKAASSSHLVTSIPQRCPLVNLRLRASYPWTIVLLIQKQNHLQRHRHLLAKHLQVCLRKLCLASCLTRISIITTSTRMASILLNIRVTTSPSIPAGRRKGTIALTARGKAGQSVQDFPTKSSLPGT